LVVVTGEALLADVVILPTVVDTLRVGDEVDVDAALPQAARAASGAMSTTAATRAIDVGKGRDIGLKVYVQSHDLQWTRHPQQPLGAFTGTLEPGCIHLACSNERHGARVVHDFSSGQRSAI
jgi:hypothetical protein